MENKKDLVVFIGCKTCGKDYQSEPFIFNGYKKIAFADPLRKMLWDILGYTPDDYSEFKKCDIISEIKTKVWGIIPCLTDLKVSSVRKMLQNLGSVIKSIKGEEYWANLWKDTVLRDESSKIVCTDARFPYEVKKALSLTRNGYNVSFVWCCYEGADFENILKDYHESERLAQYMYLNQDKYQLYDGKPIDVKVLKQILKDYPNR